MIYIVLLISFVYATLILLYKIAWNKISESKEVNYNDTVSVVVACRNEEKNIKNLIKDIMNQNFDKYRFQMIEFFIKVFDITSFISFKKLFHIIFNQ